MFSINSSAMEAGEFELKANAFTEKEKPCAVVMIFVNHFMNIETTKVAEMTEVLLRTVQKIKKLSCETRDPLAVISLKKVSQENVRRVRTTEFINKVQKMVDNDSRSFVSMAQELQHTDMVCVIEDFCCRSCVVRGM